MTRVFNLGLGFIFICSPEGAQRALEGLPDARRVGGVVARQEGPAVLVEGLPA
jgi:phosphoribosylaminoimidazole (AIR) synthetase